MTSITGEKLHLNHVRAAVRAAEDATRVEAWQFRLIPDIEACRYDLLVEPRGAGLDAQGAEAFARAFDDALGRINVEYAAKRRSRRLGSPRLCVMRAGWAERQCQAEFARGRREVQHKWPAMQPAWDRESRGEVVRVGPHDERDSPPDRSGASPVGGGGGTDSPVVARGPAAPRALGRGRAGRAGERAPAVVPAPGQARTPEDRGTFHQIMLTVYGSQAAALVELVLRRPPALPFDALGVGALLAMGAGLGLRTWAVATLGGWFTLRVGVKPAQRLVRAGPYRLIRHPSYKGAFVALIASAVLLRAWVTVVLGAIALYAAFRRRIRHEERLLAAALPGYRRLHGPDGGATAAVRTRSRRAADAPGGTEARLVPEVAGHPVAGSSLLERGLLVLADPRHLADAAARVEAAARRRLDRARHVALEQDPLALDRRDRGSAPPRGAPRCTGAADCCRAPWPARSPRSCRGTSRPRACEMCSTTERSWAMNR